MKLDQGKFIVIDGSDGSGKGTQTALITERLKKAGFSVAIADFPQYGNKSAGLVEEYLNGKYGRPKDVDSYTGSIFYAIDRYDASFKIKKWLDEGKIVICNRYVTSNMAHQGGKIENPLERKAYFSWLNNFEYDLLKIPRPDLNIILHVDADIAQKLIENKNKRDYIKNGENKDIHEKDVNHLKDAERVYQEIASAFPNFKLIECTPDGKLLSREEINNIIWEEITKVLPVNYTTPNKDNFGEELVLKIERLSPTAKSLKQAYEHDAAFDLFADDYYTLYPGDRANIKTGIRMAIPTGYAGLIWDKSGVASSGLHCLAGVIDSGFRGEILVNIINLGQDIYNISPGQKVAQIVIQKIEHPKIIEIELDDNTERGQGGFGSSGLF